MMLEQVRARLSYLEAVGLDYVTLDRTLRTLSGGEARRVALSSALGSSLVNMLYVLDEPSIGLHARDIRRLVETIARLKRRGNTVVVVEHEEADHPGGGPGHRDRARRRRARRADRLPGHAAGNGTVRPTASPATTWPAAAASAPAAAAASPTTAGSAWPAPAATTSAASPWSFPWACSAWSRA